MGKPTPNLLIAISALVARCAKHASRLSKKKATGNGSSEPSNSKVAFKPPLASPKQLLTMLSNKAMASPFLHKKKIAEESSSSGDEGLWQREILMGEKCQPLDFPGAIYYDRNGNLLSEFPPRSPRGGLSPRPGSPLHQSFSFPVSLAVD